MLIQLSNPEEPFCLESSVQSIIQALRDQMASELSSRPVAGPIGGLGKLSSLMLIYQATILFPCQTGWATAGPYVKAGGMLT